MLWSRSRVLFRGGLLLFLNVGYEKDRLSPRITRRLWKSRRRSSVFGIEAEYFASDRLMLHLFIPQTYIVCAGRVPEEV